MSMSVTEAVQRAKQAQAEGIAIDWEKMCDSFLAAFDQHVMEQSRTIEELRAQVLSLQEEVDEASPE
jgi:hypothetical protein